MLSVTMQTPPNNVSCGPSSLHTLYRYYGDNIALEQVIKEISYLDDGGTLGVFLGCHALRRGYRVIIHPYNLNIFDPTWFQDEKVDIGEKLRLQLERKQKTQSAKASTAMKAFIDYLSLGGKIVWRDLTESLIKEYTDSGRSVIAGLSSTYLYQCKRELTDELGEALYDDVGGYPAGHFVFVRGYDERRDEVALADPYQGNPIASSHYYNVAFSRFKESVLLGVAPYDGELVIIDRGVV